MEPLPKIIVILGPTASGKTNLAISLAKQFNGEVVSVDSRQMYKKMDIGTGKPVGTWESVLGEDVYMVEGVPHYLMDIIDPGVDVSLAEVKAQATKRIDDILERGKVPFLVGGTGLYIWSIIDNLEMPKVAPNKKLRFNLGKRPLSDLVRRLKKLDPESAKVIDTKNPRRVIRALEVAILSGESFTKQRKAFPPLYDALQIGIYRPQTEMYERINRRIDEQMEQGLLAETEALVKQKYGWNLQSMSSIGYKQLGSYLRGECALEEAVEWIKKDTRHYARRQMTWFKRDKRITWLNEEELPSAPRLIKKFLKD